MSFPRYPEYKDSGVEWLGKVPAHWELSTLKHIVRLVTEKATQRDHPVALENIEGWTGRLLPTDSKFEGEGTAFDKGDILFGKLRPYLAKVYLAERSGQAVGDFHVLRPQRADLQGAYLRYEMLCAAFIDIVNGSTFGSKMPRASWEFIGAMQVAFPPQGEQDSIAAFLDQETAKNDALIVEQDRLIKLLGEKRQAVISHAVTKGLNPHASMKDSGVDWLGQVPAHWEVKRLRRVSPRLAGRLIVQPHLYFADEGVPILFGNNIGRGRLYLDEVKRISFEADLRYASCRVEAGDLLTVRVGDPGATAVVPQELHGCHFASAMWIRKAPTFDSAWLSHVMNSDVVGAQVAAVNYGAAQEQFNIGDAADFLLPVPPLAEQLELVRWLGATTGSYDALATEAQRAIDLLQERRTALISAAVTGQIDVRALAPSTPALDPKKPSRPERKRSTPEKST